MKKLIIFISCLFAFLALNIEAKTQTVQIGTQVWMTTNINVGKFIPVTTKQTNNGIIEKYCYGNLESNCNIYGGLYSWDEMMNYSKVQGSQGLCPTGFHVPTKSDFTILFNYAGKDVGYKLREKGSVHWKYIAPAYSGTDIYGFTGLPSGYSSRNSFGCNKTYGYFWTSTLSPEGWGWYRILNYSAPTFYEYQGYITGPDAVNVPLRCVKNQ